MRCKNCKWILSVANAILTPEQIKLVDSGESLERGFRDAGAHGGIGIPGGRRCGAGNGETAYGLSNISPNLLRIVCFMTTKRLLCPILA